MLCKLWLGQLKLNPATTICLNSLRPGVAFLYPLKMSEKVKRFSVVFKGYREATPDCNGIRQRVNDDAC